jgi:hypothetical protein
LSGLPAGPAKAGLPWHLGPVEAPRNQEPGARARRPRGSLTQQANAGRRMLFLNRKLLVGLQARRWSARGHTFEYRRRASVIASAFDYICGFFIWKFPVVAIACRVYRPAISQFYTTPPSPQMAGCGPTLPTCAAHKVVSYLRYWRRVSRTAATAVVGRVEMWRGGGRSNISVSAPFVWRCLSGSTVAPFPHPAHRTGRADLPHSALGQDLTRLLSRATPSAVSEPFAEFIGCPISQVLHHVLRLS